MKPNILTVSFHLLPVAFDLVKHAAQPLRAFGGWRVLCNCIELDTAGVLLDYYEKCEPLTQNSYDQGRLTASSMWYWE